MRMAPNIGPRISQEESQRRSQIQDRCNRSHRAKKWTRLKTMFFKGGRGIFYFLLGAAIVTFIVAHRNEIDAVARQKVSRVVNHVQTNTQTADPFRQSALNYEKEVDKVSQ